MEVEYSNEIKGKVFAYRIMAHEKPIIIAAYKKHIIKLERAIEKVKNHPKNEGQVTYSVKALLSVAD